MKIRILFSVFFLLCVSTSSIPTVQSQDKKEEKEGVTIPSNNAKLYKALQLIDDRQNWAEVSELLREILASNIDDPFVIWCLEQAKAGVDGNWIGDLFSFRVEDLPFVVPKLYIMEAMMANHSKLNVSYDREVPLVRSLILSYLIPGYDPSENDEAAIVFPNEKTYLYSAYGYTKDNVLKTETAASGVIDDPRFPETVKKKEAPNRDRDGRLLPPGGPPGGPPGRPTGRMERPASKRASDRRSSRVSSRDPKAETLSLSGTDGTEKPGAGNAVEPTGVVDDLEMAADFYKTGIDIYTGIVQGIQEKKRELGRSQNQYHPWAMLLEGIANPDAARFDPQLRDFLKGVKLRAKLGTFDISEDQKILEEILAEESDRGLQLEIEVDSFLRKKTLYLHSTLTSPRWWFSWRSFFYIKKFMEFHHSMAGEKVYTGVKTFADTVGKLKAPHWTLKILEAPGWLLKMGLGTEGTLMKLKESEKYRKLVEWSKQKWPVKNERYFHIALAFVLANDLAEGAAAIGGAQDNYERFDALETMASRIGATALYAAPMVLKGPKLPWVHKLPFLGESLWFYLGWGALAADVGHWAFPGLIPRTSDVVETVVFDWAVDGATRLVGGKTSHQQRIEDYENRLLISDLEPHVALESFDDFIRMSQTKEALEGYKTRFEQSVRDYANKRLFMIYFFLQKWNNRTDTDFGYMERRYWENDQAYREDIKRVQRRYAEKLKTFLEDEAKAAAEKEARAKKADEERKKIGELPDDVLEDLEKKAKDKLEDNK